MKGDKKYEPVEELPEHRRANVAKSTMYLKKAYCNPLQVRFPTYESYQMHQRIEKLAHEAGLSKNGFMVQQIQQMLDVLDPQ